MPFRPRQNPATEEWVAQLRSIGTTRGHPKTIPVLPANSRLLKRDFPTRESLKEKSLPLLWAEHLELCRAEIEKDDTILQDYFWQLPFRDDRKRAAWDMAANHLKSVGIFGELAAKEIKDRGPFGDGSNDKPIRTDGADLLGVAIDNFLRVAEISKRTRENYATYLGFVREKCGDSMRVADVYRPENLLWLAKQQKDKAEASPRNETGGAARRIFKQALSSLANYLVGLELLEQNNVAKVIPSIREANKPRELITEKQLAALIESAAKVTAEMTAEGFSRTDWALIIRLLVATGVRRQGIAAMNWQDLVLSPANKASVRIKPGKSPRYVIAPLDRQLVRDLRLYRQRMRKDHAAFIAPDAPLVSQGTRRPRRNAQPDKAFARIFTGAGMEFSGYHIFRHTAAIRWLDRGLDIEDVRELLGHADLETPLKYLRWWKSLKQSDMVREKLDGISQPVSHSKTNGAENKKRQRPAK